MAARSNEIEQATEELYALPTGEFTRARDERAKLLRKEGRRDDADAVKALRKPTVAAWALNQLARRRPNEVERLVAAGKKLRAAQEELLAGGDRKAFQNAAAKERDLVAKLSAEAADLAAEAGERASPALGEKVAATLHAAALDEETAEQLLAGRLVREREAIGGFGAMTATAPPRSRGAPAKRSETAKGRGADAAKEGGRTAPRTKRAKTASKDGKQLKAAAEDTKRRRADDAKRRADAERRENAARRQRLAAARTDERHARREVEASAKTMEHAQTRAEAARAHAEEANKRAKTTVERLKQARRAQAAAKKAHARAERALKAAERES